MNAIPVMHLGPLHGFAWVFILLLAFGPLLAAVGVVLAIRRRESQEGHAPLH